MPISDWLQQHTQRWIKILFRPKSIDQTLRESADESAGSLKKTLSAVDLIGLGVGCVIGAGIFVLTGIVAREKAGPGVILSYMIDGIAMIFTALCYAEFAARVPIAGSAYAYAYTQVGELVAFIIGWSLTLEYTIASSAVARGWSGYLNTLLAGMGLEFPKFLTSIPIGDVLDIDLCAVLIIVLLTILLCVGVKGSALFNNVIVVMMLLTIFFVIIAGMFFADIKNWTPFLPYGFSGVMAGSATIVFAYVGFDAVSTTAEEVKNPARDLPIGMTVSSVAAVGPSIR
eukprot:TRINITY_DN22990_c0_g1_i1.p1 TRINITY_DN22990_c0_g1~~TRINITY_DN22990_c0_g1_i1.p1  ORF type:complete len:310 (-),score=77.76 TRINITY_DN22990_c0_g1_i1:226-1083(-)